MPLSTHQINKGGTLWFTGLSGAGKSTLSQAVYERLQTLLGTQDSLGKSVFILDGDIIRRGLNKDLGFSAEDRAENIRRIGEVAKLVTLSGQICIVAFISPYKKDRDEARLRHQESNLPFVECHIAANLEVCEQRDVKGLYKKARAGDIPNFTGVSDPYEEPEAPELKVETGEKSLETCVDEVLVTLQSHGLISEQNIEIDEQQLSIFSHQNIYLKQFLDTPSHGQIVEYINFNEILRGGQIGLSSELRDSQYKPLVIIGPSGVGKSTLIEHLQAKHFGQFKFSVSSTTRQPREGEVHGVNYNFITKEEFQKQIENEEFVEWMEVHGNYYGTSKVQIQDIMNEKKIPLLDIDIKGAIKFHESFPQANNLFIFPPSTAALEKRLRGRGTETEESLAKRLKNSRGEITRGLQLDDPTNLIGYRLVNNNLDFSRPAFLRLIEGLYYQELPEVQNDLPVDPEDQVKNIEVIQQMIQEVEQAKDEDEAPVKASNGHAWMMAGCVASFALGVLFAKKR